MYDIQCVVYEGILFIFVGHGAFSHLFDAFFIPAYLNTHKDLHDERMEKMKGWTVYNNVIVTFRKQFFMYFRTKEINH